MTSLRPVSLLAELHASEVLAAHGELEGKIESVDATLVAAGIGAQVYWSDLSSDNIDSFLYCPVAGQPEITVHQYSPHVLRRFSTAHQLGHLMYLREGGSMSGSGIVDEAGSFTDEKLIEYSKNGEDIMTEQYANSFAAALLLPRQLFTGMLTANIKHEKIAEKLSVSLGAVIYRVKMLEQQKILLSS